MRSRVTAPAGVPAPPQTAGWRVPAVAGMLLIAATYGMARFGVGLFAPSLAAERPELVEALGWAAAAQFVAYCVAAAAAARLVVRRPRTVLVLAGASATTGCLGVAVATDPVVFVVAVFVGGTSGGFASPAVVVVIDAVVPPGSAVKAQSVANAGTAVGVVAAGSLAFTVTSTARAWTAMALVCVVAAVAACWPARGRTRLAAGVAPVAGRARTPAARGSLALPIVAAVVVGAGSSALWTFGPLLLTTAGSVAEGDVGWLWIAVGLGGGLGCLTGTLVERTGRSAAWRICAGVLVLADLGVGLSLSLGVPWVAYASMAAFGAGYMSLTAVLILWARHVQPDDAGAATSVLFVALAVGQAAGAAGFGAAAGLVSPVLVTVLAAALCAAGGLVVLPRGRPRLARPTAADVVEAAPPSGCDQGSRSAAAHRG